MVKKAVRSPIQTPVFHIWNGVEQYPKRTQCHLELFLTRSGSWHVAQKERYMLTPGILWLGVQRGCYLLSLKIEQFENVALQRLCRERSLRDTKDTVWPQRIWGLWFFKYWIPTEPGGSFYKEECVSVLAGQSNRLLMAQGSHRASLCSVHHSSIGLGCTGGLTPDSFA